MQVKSTHSDQAYRAYLKNIMKFSLLSREQKLDLARRIETGSDSARKQLIEANLRLVVKIACQYKAEHIPLLDLIQEGNLGLIRAADKFNYRRNIKFSRYAAFWIKDFVLRALYKNKSSLKIPYRVACKEMRNGTYVTKYKILSLDNLPGTGDEVHSQAEIPDLSFNPDKIFFRKTMKEDILRLLNRLDKKEKMIIEKRILLSGYKKYTLHDISLLMGHCIETVRRLEIRALKSLAAQGWQLYVYLEDHPTPRAPEKLVHNQSYY